MKQARVLTTEELNSAIAHAVNHTGKWARRNRMLLLLSHTTGMRVGEIASLTLSDVLDLSGNVLAEILLTPAQTKGHRSRRVLLPQRTQTELRNYIRHQFAADNLRGLAYQYGTKPLFYSQKLNRFTANQLSAVYARLYRTAGLRGATSHTGRRTWITALCQKGANVRAIQVLAGHQSLSTTQRYIEVGDHVLRSVAEMAC
jgi:integrase/recombinase XerD